VAVKKTAKKAAKKSPAKKTAAKKSPAKKAVAKKKTAKKAVAKRAVAKKTAKKSPAKKAATKRVVKKTAKKAVAKKVVKKTAKKAPAKRVVKKATTTRVSSAPAASTAPAKSVAPVVAAKPVAAPKASTSNRTAWIVVIGIVILVAIVWSKSAGTDGDDAAAPAPEISQSAEPSASAEPTATESTGPAVAAVEAPTKFVALKSPDGLKLRWIAPTAVDGLTGYNVEIRANGAGEWTVIATVPADQLTQNVTKASDSGWTQFRVSSVYSDGQTASATAFGIPGEFK
jgi:hypothetical protein